MSLILGIDTSCDDTSFAVLDTHKGSILSNVVSSQTKIHIEHGGIVPELASRAHLENLSAVFNESLHLAGINLSDLNAVAVTNTPGLIGCLLVGTSFARGLALRLGVPLYGVNHLEGHLFSPFIGASEIPFPFLGLVVSGGHTAFYQVDAVDQIKLVGQTVDDAAGEAFDKCAKMMGLGYPGGPVIDKLALSGRDNAFAFTIAKVKMGEQYLSFSGLKTAAFQHLQKINTALDDGLKNDFSASVQKAIVTTLCQKMDYFLTQHSYRAVAVSGGVAMNSLLRKQAGVVCSRRGVLCRVAEPAFCTDNGAMIAFVASLSSHKDQLFELQTLATKKTPVKRGVAQSK